MSWTEGTQIGGYEISELLGVGGSTSFVVAAGGQWFLFARATGSDRVSVILNWAQLVPK